MISVKFGFTAVSTPVLNDSPAPVNTESKKKIVVVHKKNALAASGMIPAEVAVVWL